MDDCRSALALGSSSRPLIPGMLMSERMKIERYPCRISDAWSAIGADWANSIVDRSVETLKLLLLAFIAVASEAMAQDAQCVRERAAMVDTIRAYARFEAGVLGPQGISERVLEALGQTERHRFIRERSCSVAYMDTPVLIGHDQTISQPFIVALMTHLAALKSDDTVLEVGTGSGYQAALLARLVRKVCTVEIIPPLAEAAAKVLRELGYHVPPPLIEQLKVSVFSWLSRASGCSLPLDE